MIITTDILKRFNACESALKQFADKYPDGIDIAPLWNNNADRAAFWQTALTDPFVRKYVGWTIRVGILPARIIGDFKDADLRGADLWGADLRNADLRGANLWGADLWGANLRNANLCDADLCDADLRNADLWSVKYNEGTQWPNGFDYEAATNDR